MQLIASAVFNVTVLLSLVGGTIATSCSPGRPFPPPLYATLSLQEVFNQISNTLSDYFAVPAFDATNVALEVTSSQETLWSFYHAAENQSSQDGTSAIGTDTVFRVARVSKLFTAIAVLQLHDQGYIASLHAPVKDYIPDLEPSKVEWGRITIWDLLNNMAGVLDMCSYIFFEDAALMLKMLFSDGYADILTDFTTRQRTDLSLPLVSKYYFDAMPACQRNRSIPCDAAGLLHWLRSSAPIFDPHSVNSNSNVGFSLLGIMIARITGMDYEQYIFQTLIQPLGLNSTSFTAPDKSSGAVLHNDHTWEWNVGVNNPSVGLYSTARDISILLRWTLRTDVSSTLNWFAPGSYAVGTHSLIGMPWNIFRTTAIPSTSNRRTTFNTVVGTLGMYSSVVVVIPEYDLAFSLMMSGALGHPHGILTNISFPLVRAADDIAWANVRNTYAGKYEAEPEQNINSSIMLLQSPDRGLYFSEWISNGSSILPVMERLTAMKSGGGSSWIFQAVPTLLKPERREMLDGKVFVDEEWRWTYVLDKPSDEGWNDWCLSSFDPVTYASEPLTKMVFRKDAESGSVVSVALSGYNITLRKITQATDGFPPECDSDLLAEEAQKVLS